VKVEFKILKVPPSTLNKPEDYEEQLLIVVFSINKCPFLSMLIKEFSFSVSLIMLSVIFNTDLLSLFKDLGEIFKIPYLILEISKSNS